MVQDAAPDDGQPDDGQPDDGEPDDGAVADPPGIDASAVTAWLSRRAEVVAPLAFERVAGGRSNLTYRVTDRAGRRWVLRRPPLHSVLAGAHDVAREHRVMAALADSPVPVPTTVGLEPDPGVLDAPFYVMDFVDAHVVRTAADADALDRAARGRAARDLVDVLADLHALSPDEVGLGDLGTRSDYLARQLHVWHRQYERGASREVPAITTIRDRLVADLPPQQVDGIVHGDYRLDNLMLADDGTVVAVLDWELCTLGDPLADLGLLKVYWDAVDDDGGIPMIPSAATIPGVPPFDDVLDRYAARSPLDLSRLDHYVAFGYWKLAVVLEGVLARNVSGAYGSSDVADDTRLGEVVHVLLDRADAVATRAGA